MKHIPDIRLINSHSKCIGGNHNLATVINKIILIVPSFFIRKPCVISGCRISLLNQLLAHFFHKLPGNTVYDSTFCPVFCYIIPYKSIFIPGCLHRKKQVLPVKSCSGHKRLLKLKDINNILFNLLCGSSCKGTYNRTVGKPFYKFHDFQIAGAKILSPLRHTVSFIHCNHGNLYMKGEIQKFFIKQSLRSYIDNRVSSCFRKPEHCIILHFTQ